MTDDQARALELLRFKYHVGGVASLPDGRVQLESGNGATPYFFVDEDGEVEDEDGYPVHLPNG
jgi:hypothetical protein